MKNRWLKILLSAFIAVFPMMAWASVSTYNAGTEIYTGTQWASGGWDITIPHGLGQTPNVVQIKTECWVPGLYIDIQSLGFISSSTASSWFQKYPANGNKGGVSSYPINCFDSSSNTTIYATSTLDSTNIVLHFYKDTTGSFQPDILMSWSAMLIPTSTVSSATSTEITNNYIVSSSTAPLFIQNDAETYFYGFILFAITMGFIIWLIYKHK